MTKFRCGFCLQEKEEKKTRRFGFMAWTPSHMECQRREGKAGFFICIGCMKKHKIREVKPRLISNELVSIQPMKEPASLIFYRKIRRKPRAPLFPGALQPHRVAKHRSIKWKEDQR